MSAIVKVVVVVIRVVVNDCGDGDQGSRKSKIGLELTKNGCHVWSPGLSEKPYICSFQTNYPYNCGFYAYFLGF